MIRPAFGTLVIRLKKIGVERSEAALKKADLVLLILDSSEELTDEDMALVKETDGKKRIIILNKTDLGQKITTAGMRKLTSSAVISTSILKEKNLDELENTIKKTVLLWY